MTGLRRRLARSSEFPPVVQPEPQPGATRDRQQEHLSAPYAPTGAVQVDAQVDVQVDSRPSGFP